MNDTIRNIKSRRSVKKYKSDMVPEELINEIVSAGTCAPTGMNKQSPIILSITNKEIRDKNIRENISNLADFYLSLFKEIDGENAEVVQSLAKWKRMALYRYGYNAGEGIYTDMNAIRADEKLGNLHSLYVDQWDWELVITGKDRTVAFLKDIVTRIYAAMLRTEFMVCETYPQITPFLPEKLFFIHSEELRQMYPDLSAKEREDRITREYGAVFIIGIGAKLADGKEHDLRAPDYDDYSTIGENGLPGLNGDLLIWDSVIDRAVELSSMGIRVDREALLRQLTLSGKEERKELYFHRRLLDGTLPLSIGGGIGQSRLCMVYLRKAHIGEIQASIWPEDMRQECAEWGMPLI